MRRQIFTEEQDAFRDMVRAFIAKEITPYHDQWERDGIVSRDVWLAAGRAGLLGIHLDEKYGGGGQPDYRFYVILNEELARAGASGPMFQLHNDMIGPYLDRLCSPEQRDRWFPGYCSGELIAAIAMTEPGAGSDLQGIRSTAVRDGDHYVLNGQKTFISNGQLADIVIVVARTDPDAGHRGISLLMVERGMPGFAPTQGHLASALCYLPHAVRRLTSGDANRVHMIAKGSLFLGRMTQASDGMSVLLERNQGSPAL